MEYKITVRTIKLKKIYELRDPKRGWRTVWVIDLHQQQGYGFVKGVWKKKVTGCVLTYAEANGDVHRKIYSAAELSQNLRLPHGSVNYRAFMRFF